MRNFAQLNLFTSTKILLVFPLPHIRGLETLLLETYELKKKKPTTKLCQISFIGSLEHEINLKKASIPW